MAAVNCHDSSVENDDSSVENGEAPSYLWSCAFKLPSEGVKGNRHMIIHVRKLNWAVAELGDEQTQGMTMQ